MVLELLLIRKHFYFFLPPAHESCVLREPLPIYRTCVVIKAEISFMACDTGRKERYQRQSSSRDLWTRCCTPAGKSGLWSSCLVLGSVWGPTHKDSREMSGPTMSSHLSLQLAGSLYVRAGQSAASGSSCPPGVCT